MSFRLKKSLELTKEIQEFLYQEAKISFLRYVKIWSTSDDKSNSTPSTTNQLDFGKILVDELKKLKLENILQDEHGYVYAEVPPSENYENSLKIGFIAHLDTSPAVSGKNVNPIVHENYDGKEIEFQKNAELSLSIDDSPQLKDYIGKEIITSDGSTLLGADDKAGVAEIMTACLALKKFPELKHGPIFICFTPDEEIGRGTAKINLDLLPKICYTVDGSEMGQLEIECFDAWGVKIQFKGLSVHPGYAKDLMINAIHIASRFLSEIPENESPERTEEREGFYHLSELNGNEEEAIANLIIRDFNIENNEKRIKLLKYLKDSYEKQYKGLKITLEIKHQYENMINYLQEHEEIINLAKMAIEKAGLEIKFHSIRGGTDGAQLSAKEIPTPNIFTGGLLFHSRKEYIPTVALQKATEVIIYLVDLWAHR